MATTAVAAPESGAEDRTQFLGASDMGAILGVDPFKTALQVYEEKVGLAPAFQGNQHTKRGQKLEQLAAEDFMERTGKIVHRMNARLVHPVYPFITGRIDRRVVGERALVEIKNPSLGSYSKIKRTGLHEGYIAQMHTYLGLTQYEVGYWHIFCADQMEGLPFPVEFDQHLYNQIVDRAASFWLNHVVPRIPPVAIEQDEARLEIRRAEGAVKLVDLSGEPEFLDAARMLAEAKALKAEADTLEETAKERVKGFIGEEPGVYVGPGVRVSWTMTAGRTSFDKAALAAAKPLDRQLTEASIIRYLRQVGYSEEDALHRALEIQNGSGLDLSKFDKRGKPFGQLRLTTGGLD